MFQRKPSRFRRRPGGSNHRPHSNNSNHNRMRNNSFSNGHSRNNFRNTQSAEKLLEKYNLLAKEALSSGDKTLSENYLQHADHFLRIIVDKNKLRNQTKPDEIVKNEEKNKNSSNDTKTSTEEINNDL